MDKPIFKIEYYLENDNMTDEENENQEEQEFIITRQMLYDLVRENVDLGDCEIDQNNFYICKL